MLNDKEVMIKQIIEAPLDMNIFLVSHSYIKTVKFFYQIGENFFSWRAEAKYHTIYPMKNTTDILTFKTLNGAKRNFIRGYLL